MYNFNDNFKLVVSATFTANLLGDSLNFWKKKLNIPMEIEFTALNSIFEELANPNGAMRTNPYCNLIMIRFDDWCRSDSVFEDVEGKENAVNDKILKTIDELSSAIKNAVMSDHNMYIVGTCSTSEHTKDLDINSLENKLLDAIKDIPGVYSFSGTKVLESYPVEDYYDAYTDQVGHIPYKQIYYDAYGTYLMRKLVSIYSKPYKVIVADCDNTLWDGIVGEDGVNGIKISKARKAIQSFLVKKSNEGYLICLNSKNNQSDVDEVFSMRSDMVLKKDYIVASRINWERKSDNLKSIASELNLGLDSFVFLDDSKQECMEVRSSCPDVTTLCLPENEEDIPEFLNNLWILDKTSVTKDDKNRTKMYQDNAKRQAFKAGQASLRSFIEGLNMKVTIKSITDEEKERAYELMWRINQFNLSGKKMDRQEYVTYLSDDKNEFATVHASDRFGDYGMVGLVFGRKDENMFKLDNLMMSCRVIGKGVEYDMLSYIGKLALDNGLNQVKVNIKETEKNAIAMDFANKVFNQKEAITVGSDELAKVDFNDFLDEIDNKNSIKDDSGQIKDNQSLNETKPNETIAEEMTRFAGTIEEIATSLKNINVIHKEIIKERINNLEEKTPYVAPQNEIQEKIAAIWEEVLEVSPIGIHNSIFELGGDSIQAIQILSRVRDEFETDIPLTVLFEDDLTVEHLAQATENSILDGIDEDVLNEELSQIENMSDEEIAELLKGELD